MACGWVFSSNPCLHSATKTSPWLACTTQHNFLHIQVELFEDGLNFTATADVVGQFSNKTIYRKVYMSREGKAKARMNNITVQFLWICNARSDILMQKQMHKLDAQHITCILKVPSPREVRPAASRYSPNIVFMTGV